MITLKQLTLRHGARVLLENVNWTIYHKQRIGIVGANGCGKTSLFSLLLGEHSPDLGELQIPRQIKLAHVAQETIASAQTALDFVLDGDQELRAIERELQHAEQVNDGMQIAALHEKLGIVDGYTAPARAAQLLTGLGFESSAQQNPVRAFSGGWRMRLNLAQALMCRSDVLLLDEPTNHLDLDTVMWLEEWLLKYPGTLLLISHDRDFLDRIVDHVAYIANQQLKVYTGNYSSFETLHANELLLQQAAYEKQQQHISHMQSFIDRFKAKASKAKQAQSRAKAIARMDILCAVQTESPFQFEFRAPKSSPQPLIALEHIDVGYPEKLVLKNISLSIAPKDRIGILGPNGAGKSSFIKTLAGVLAPLAGKRSPSSGLQIGYFAQHQVEYLPLHDSPLTILKDIAKDEPELNLRKFLGTFDFSGDKVLQPIQHFSGGEKSRLALALIIWQRPNLLLLDEPTNHLDMEMRNALSIALQEYEGAMLLVSHDRFLVRSTADQLWLVADNSLAVFDGDISEYQQWFFEYKKNLSAPKAQPKAHKNKNPDITKKIAALEEKLTTLNHKLATLENSLAEPNLQHQQLSAYLAQQETLRQEIIATENMWLNLCEQKDS